MSGIWDDSWGGQAKYWVLEPETEMEMCSPENTKCEGDDGERCMGVYVMEIDEENTKAMLEYKKDPNY